MELKYRYNRLARQCYLFKSHLYGIEIGMLDSALKTLTAFKSHLYGIEINDVYVVHWNG